MMGDNYSEHGKTGVFSDNEHSLPIPTYELSKSAKKRLRKNLQKNLLNIEESNGIFTNTARDELTSGVMDSGAFWGADSQVIKTNSQESFDSSIAIPSTHNLDDHMDSEQRAEPTGAKSPKLEADVCSHKSPLKQTDNSNMEAVDVHMSSMGKDYLYQKETGTTMDHDSNQENVFRQNGGQSQSQSNFERQIKTTVSEVPVERNVRESNCLMTSQDHDEHKEFNPQVRNLQDSTHETSGHFRKEDLRERRFHQHDSRAHARKQAHCKEKANLSSFQPVGTQWNPEHVQCEVSGCAELNSPMAEFDIGKRRSEIAGAVRSRRSRPLTQHLRDLVYWRNSKDSGIIFGFGLLLLLSLSYFSIISIFAYLSMTTMIVVTGIVLIRQISLAFQQQSGEHPFRLLLEKDVVFSPEYAHQQLDNILKPFNRTMVRIRNLYLADSLGQTLKLIFFMYILTYVGSWFNLLTLLTLVWIAAFTVPKFYETYKEQIDSVLHLVMEGIHDIKVQFTSKLNQQLSKIRPVATRINRSRPVHNGGKIRTHVGGDGKKLESEIEFSGPELNANEKYE